MTDKLVIGIVSPDHMNSYFARCLFNLFAEVPGAAKGLIHVISGPWMPQTRNMVTEIFLKSDADRLVMMDTDIIFQPDHVRRLVEHEVDFVSGLYVAHDGRRMASMEQKGNGYVWPMETEEFPEGMSKVLATGAGFQAVHRRVFEAIGGGWFNYLRDLGEDVAFCERAREAGFDVWLDSTIQVGHMKLHAFMP